ncbi:MAG: phosphoenolpyruvate synthase, partial [Chromatiales bacterium]|nr:phosphoenolpyruvate synthase [Chromatiales bacterium]
MRFVKGFAELGIDDVSIVGGKNASLGEMYRALSGEGIKVPNGFATTAEGFRLYIEHNNLHQKIAAELERLDTHNVNALQVSGAKIRQWIMHGEMPAELAAEIREAYRGLESEYG